MGQERLPYELLGDLAPLAGCIPAVEARPRIRALQAEGMGPTQIARRLNIEGVLTPSGRGRWYCETVQRHIDPARWNAYMRDYRGRRALMG